MGTYLNPGNRGFEEILRSDYVDKTGMIGLINGTIGTKNKLTCISRPRRFGKSFAAQMLCAYYDRTCDSRSLFENCRIAQDPSFEEHLNRYDVIYLDMTTLLGNAAPSNLLSFLVENVTEELVQSCPGLTVGRTFDQTLVNYVEYTGNRFFMIVDEWDAPVRESPAVEKDYLKFLRTLFKSSSTTPRIFAGVYMTGILPIKKDGSQSAISDFQEYSVLDPGPFAEYTGFTEEEVRELCLCHSLSFANARRWYDGYTVGTEHSVYNPYSVMCAVKGRSFRSYWKKTSAAEALMTYIDMDLDGLQEDIARFIAGESLAVDTDSFQNDVNTFTCKDDVLTLLIHLGYLTCEEVVDSYEEGLTDEPVFLARIPNDEVRTEFKKILRRAKHSRLLALIRKSDRLLRDTLEGNEEAVAEALQEIHASEYAPAFYNHEQSLRYVIKLAYITCVDQYAKVEELPSGHGIADIVYLPKRRSPLPAMIIELKWNKSGEGALAQIRDRRYPQVLKDYGGRILLIGINYNAQTKEHSCRIEEISADHN